jgi:hypothetical protein
LIVKGAECVKVSDWDIILSALGGFRIN